MRRSLLLMLVVMPLVGVSELIHAEPLASEVIETTNSVLSLKADRAT